MKKIRVRCIVDGRAKGPLLISRQPIAFLQGVDPERGCVSDPKHEIFEKPFSGRILVFPNAIGSSVGAYVIYRLKKKGTAPKAIINQKTDIITASGCALAGIPLFDLLENEIPELETDQRVVLDGERSEMIIY